MKKVLVFLIFGLYVGLLWPSSCNADGDIKVSAVVLEHLTYIRTEKTLNISTNLDTGYWDLKDGNYRVIISRF